MALNHQHIKPSPHLFLNAYNAMNVLYGKCTNVLGIFWKDGCLKNVEAFPTTGHALHMKLHYSFFFFNHFACFILWVFLSSLPILRHIVKLTGASKIAYSIWLCGCILQRTGTPSKDWWHPMTQIRSVYQYQGCKNSYCVLQKRYCQLDSPWMIDWRIGIVLVGEEATNSFLIFGVGKTKN